MFIKDLEDAVRAMQQWPKLPKKIKMVKWLYDCLEFSSEFEGYPPYYWGIPVVIDDEIDGLYKFIYKEN